MIQDKTRTRPIRYRRETTIDQHPRQFLPHISARGYHAAEYAALHAAFLEHKWIINAEPGIPYCPRHDRPTDRDRDSATCDLCLKEASEWQLNRRRIADPTTQIPRLALVGRGRAKRKK